MKVRHLVCWSALAALPQLALAADPPGELGALQAVYDFCAKVDPAQSKDFGNQAGLLFKGLTQRQINAIRGGAEYHRGYQMLTGILPELQKSDAVQGCQAISGEPIRQARRIGGQDRPGRR